MLMDKSTAVDESMGIKTYIISDNIKEFKYYVNDTLSKNITKIKLNKTINKL
jgi:hypothetical protein